MSWGDMLVGGAAQESMAGGHAQFIRHFQMNADGLQNSLPFLRIEIEPRHEAVCELHALSRVLAGASPLARIVQKQREQKQVKPIDLRQQLRKSLFVIVY